jgi:1,4-alpha-glucan branching enzyme
MPGDPWQRFANLRCLYALMWSYPGKKLLFMGGEWGSPKEWHHDESLPWHLLAEESHQGIKRFVRALNLLYRDYPSLHQGDHHPSGFRWISHDDHASSVLVFVRTRVPCGQSQDPPMPGHSLLVICNFTPIPRTRYRIGTPIHADWKILLNSDELNFGGSGYSTQEGSQGFAQGAYISHQAIAWQGQSHSIELDLPPLAVIYLVPLSHDARGLA